MSEYDYVIVGAGSAGCLLAARLSEDPGRRVLLIEAGGKDRSPKIKIPAAFAQQFQTKLDWNFETEPEPGCANRRIFIPRGKSLGGSSSMNAMLYVRGCATDYDGWAAQGCEGWSWDQVLPYFNRSERREGGGGEHHGDAGTLNVADPRSPRRLTDLIVEAVRANDFPLDPEYNDGQPDGVCMVQTTQKQGRRWSAADAFLRPAMHRPNLTVLTKATVLGLVLEGERALGVRYSRGRSAPRVVKAGAEVILTAGSIGSPQLLLLSGIGAAEELTPLGLTPRVDLPGVGRNLHDHPFVVGIWESVIGESLLDAEKPRAMLDFLRHGEGPLTSTVAEAFLWTRADREAIAPDLQFHLAPAYFADNGFEESDEHAYTIGPVLVAPRSRGRLWLRSADPTAKPAILGNYLTEQADIDAMLHGVKLARRLASTEPLAAATGREIYPGPGVQGDEQMIADIRERMQLLYHPVGTCKMGVGDDAVVDPELRVRGVEGLRVIDASVMPTITRGNTNAPVYMIAEKGADLVKAAAK
jgi:choline dehydrogenase-like flavoprotein